MVTIGKLIKDLREEKGLTPTQAARSIGMSLTTYKNWESGKVTKHKMDTLFKVANYYSIAIDYFFPPDLVCE